MIKICLSLILSITMIACATNPSLDSTPSASNPPEVSNHSDKKIAGYSEKLVKSPNGYVINGPKAIFCGFIGDCASDENFPLYWECQAENGGDSFNWQRCWEAWMPGSWKAFSDDSRWPFSLQTSKPSSIEPFLKTPCNLPAEFPAPNTNSLNIAYGFNSFA